MVNAELKRQLPPRRLRLFDQDRQTHAAEFPVTYLIAKDLALSALEQSRAATQCRIWCVPPQCVKKMRHIITINMKRKSCLTMTPSFC